MSNDTIEAAVASEPKTELDPVDRWRSYAVYMEAVAARNAVIALQNKIGFHDAERRVVEAQIDPLKKELQAKDDALKKELATLQIQYSVPEGWNLDLSTGKIVASPKQVK